MEFKVETAVLSITNKKMSFTERRERKEEAKESRKEKMDVDIPLASEAAGDKQLHDVKRFCCFHAGFYNSLQK